jgi:hypothetical protein
MPKFSDYHIAQMADLRRRVDTALKGRASLWDAGQTLADILFAEFKDSLVLARVFATLALERLPEREKLTVMELATSRHCTAEISSDTMVVSLIGTRGKKEKWNDRNRSRAHLVVPLLSSSFIKTIPLVAWLMSDTGTGIGWIESQRDRIQVRSLGQMARLVHVDDAATALTSDGFKIVPAQEFVSKYAVRTVLGLGGSYLNRAFVSIILFTNESISPEAAEKLMPLVNTFKTATMKFVMTG